MKKLKYITITASALILGITGCSSQGVQSQNRDENKLQVVASFYPMYDFAQKVGGDRAQVTNMVPAGTEPHDWEPSPVDLATLEEADIFIYNGAGMEHWVEDILETLDNEELVVLEASQGLTLLEGESGYDPHVWLNPLNGEAQMEKIAEIFYEADPENEAYYRENCEEYAKQFEKLDDSFRQGLADTRSKDIIVAHEAFGYLCDAYGLNQVAIEGLSPDSEPDPGRMDEIIQFAKEHQVKTIFFEEQVSSKVAQTIADEIGAKTQVLNTLEGLSEDAMTDGADYFSVMEENLKVLREALNQ